MKPEILSRTDYANGYWEVVGYKLPSSCLGTERQLTVHRFTSHTAGPKTYMQAGLHAGEHPGILVLHELISLIQQACENGHLMGEVIIVPCANPVGLSQYVNGELVGRFDLQDNGNFNRQFPNIIEQTLDACDDCDKAGSELVLDTVRDIADQFLRIGDTQGEVDRLKAILFSLALSADMVFDLHCDGNSVLHIYAPESHIDHAAELSSELGCNIVLTGTDVQSRSFEDSLNLFWREVTHCFQDSLAGDTPYAVTVELRGRADVDTVVAKEDAASFARFLARKGQLQSAIPNTQMGYPEYIRPLEALHQVRAESPGLVTYAIKPGSSVCSGQLLGQIIDPLNLKMTPSVKDIYSAVDGVVFSTHHTNMIRTGQVLFKIAGEQPRQEISDTYLER